MGLRSLPEPPRSLPSVGRLTVEVVAKRRTRSLPYSSRIANAMRCQTSRQRLKTMTRRSHAWQTETPMFLATHPMMARAPAHHRFSPCSRGRACLESRSRARISVCSINAIRQELLCELYRLDHDRWLFAIFAQSIRVFFSAL